MFQVMLSFLWKMQGRSIFRAGMVVSGYRALCSIRFQAINLLRNISPLWISLSSPYVSYFLAWKWKSWLKKLPTVFTFKQNFIPDKVKNHEYDFRIKTKPNNLLFSLSYQIYLQNNVYFIKRCSRVMSYNHAICWHPHNDRFPFHSGFFLMTGVFPAVASGVLIWDLIYNYNQIYVKLLCYNVFFLDNFWLAEIHACVESVKIYYI